MPQKTPAVLAADGWSSPVRSRDFGIVGLQRCHDFISNFYSHSGES